MERTSGEANVNGTRLNYVIAGEGDPVVFIHGLTLDLRMWEEQISFFSDHFQVITYDLRGYVLSDEPEVGGAYSYADELAALLRHLGIAKAAIIGLSLGGWIAQEFAISYPEMVSSLVLVDSSIGGASFGPRFAATLHALHTWGREGRLAEAKAQWVADLLFAHSANVPGVSARLQQMVDEYRNFRIMNDDPQRPLDPPTKDQLGSIAARTLVIVGEHDLPDFHEIASTLASGIPDARHLVLPDAGHMANMDAPGAFNEVVLEFLVEGTAAR